MLTLTQTRSMLMNMKNRKLYGVIKKHIIYDNLTEEQYQIKKIINGFISDVRLAQQV